MNNLSHPCLSWSPSDWRYMREHNPRTYRNAVAYWHDHKHERNAIIDRRRRAVSKPTRSEVKVERMIKGRKMPAQQLGARLIAAASRVMLVSEADIKGRSRKADVSRARQIVMYIMCKWHGKSLVHTGRVLGRDHSTVIHSVKAVSKWLPELEGKMLEIQKLANHMSVDKSETLDRAA